MFRVTRAALYQVQPSRRKLKNGQRRRFAKTKATLQQGLPRSKRGAAPLANSGRSRCQTAKLVHLRMFEDVRSRSLKRHVSAQQIEST
jgi:hypothetical protein